MKNQFIEIPASKFSLSRRKLIYGVGVNDADYMTNMVSPDGNNIACPYYQKWVDIIQRTHSEKYLIRYPTYRDCTICDEWLKFSKFKSWMIKQDWEGKCLDKDVIKPGNKHYSPKYCAFVSQHVNLILTTRKRHRGSLPVGVHKNKRGFAAIVSVNGKYVKLGTYGTKEGASKAYGAAKHDAIIDLASKQSNPRVRRGLELHAMKYLNCEVE